METIFAHGIGRADFLGGAVRLELATLVPDAAAGTAGPRADTTHVVFMPLEGFLKGVATLEALVQRFAEAGMIRAREPSQLAATVPTAELPPCQPSSPAPAPAVAAAPAPAPAVAPAPAAASAPASAPAAAAPTDRGPISPNFR